MGTERRDPHPTRHGRPAVWLGPSAAALLVLAGCARPSASALPPAFAMAPGPALGVVREGWHTGLIVPETELRGALRPLRWRFAPTRFLIIGWGQRCYYMAHDPGLLAGLRALFPSASVIHIRPWRPRPAPGASRHRTWLQLPAGGWRGLRAFLGRAFAQHPKGHFEALGAHGRRGVFFASTETYNAFHTCNTWTMQALHAARLPAPSTGVVFAGQVARALRLTPLRRFQTTSVIRPGHGPSP